MLNVVKYFHEEDNIRYGYVVAETGEPILVMDYILDCVKGFGPFKIKGKTLEKRKLLVLPIFILPYLDAVAYAMDSYVESLDNKEEGLETVPKIGLKTIINKCIDDFYDTVESSSDFRDSEAKESFVKMFELSLAHNKHPLNKTLKELKFHKFYTNNKQRIKKEYAIRVGMGYTITIATTKYMLKDDSAVVLEFDTFSLPYEVLIKLEKELNK